MGNIKAISIPILCIIAATSVKVSAQNPRTQNPRTETVPGNPVEKRIRFDFENFELNPGKNYYTFHEVNDYGEKLELWGNGNSGFKLAGAGSEPHEFPTSPYEHGLEGYCLKLETRKTGSFATALNMPIAAGNMFVGSFSANIFSPLKSTRFGKPFDFAPTRLTGYYKYTAGEEYIGKDGNVIPEMRDKFNIFAILYETDSNVPYIHGKNFRTSKNIISVARIRDEDKKETDEWTYFNLLFECLEGKSIDREKLANKQYNLAVVFTSSIGGAEFNGAAGSTLLIDNVELVYIE